MHRFSLAEVGTEVIFYFRAFSAPSVAVLGHAVVLLSGAVVPQALAVVPASGAVVPQVLTVVPLLGSGSTVASGQAQLLER